MANALRYQSKPQTIYLPHWCAFQFTLTVTYVYTNSNAQQSQRVRCTAYYFMNSNWIWSKTSWCLYYALKLPTFYVKNIINVRVMWMFLTFLLNLFEPSYLRQVRWLVTMGFSITEAWPDLVNLRNKLWKSYKLTVWIISLR